MKKMIKFIRILLTILTTMTGGCSPIIRAIEWPEIEYHRGQVDLKIRPVLTDPTRDTQAASVPSN